MIFAEIILLIAALSVDSLAASISYGLAKIKIGFCQSILISLICSGFLFVSVALSGAIGGLMPEEITKAGSFIILFTIGAIKFFQNIKNEQPERLSVMKTVLFAVSMSLDGLAAGFGAGLTAEDNVLYVGIAACIITFAAVFFGNAVGLRIGKNAPGFIQKIGGIAIIIVAVCKLI